MTKTNQYWISVEDTEYYILIISFFSVIIIEQFAFVCAVVQKYKNNFLLFFFCSGADCGFKAIATKVSQPITSPGWPNNYPNNASCIWFITAGVPDGRILLEFSTVVIESCCDKLLVNICYFHTYYLNVYIRNVKFYFWPELTWKLNLIS